MAVDNSIGKHWRFKDLTGQRFGKLTVLSRAASIDNDAAWLCRCDCGAETTVRSGNLKRAKACTKWCSRVITTHGMARTKEYRAWRGIKKRCLVKSCALYKNYGGRGIGMFAEWQDSFEAFYRYVGKAPSPSHSIDRVNNDGNYEPGNVRWATYTQQARNTRRNHLLTHDGISMCISDWADFVGIRAGVIFTRLHHGWDVDRALTTPVQKHVRKKKSA